MFYLLFTAYLALFCWLITRIRFFRDTGLGNYIVIALFLARIVFAMVNAYLNTIYNPFTDVNSFHLQGIAEYNLLFHHTREYFVNIFHNTHSEGFGNFLESSDSFWNDTRSNLIVKMLSIFDIFSGKNFFIDSLFFNFLVFFGSVALYKVFIKVFHNEKQVLIVCLFLLPSATFFSSAVHRDGIIFLSLSLVIYQFYFMMKNRRYPWKSILITLFFLMVILLIRNFVFIILIPALLAWFIAKRRSKNAFAVFLIVHLTLAVLFFATAALPPAYNLPAHVSSRQSDFIKIGKGGTSTININQLQPNVWGFLKNAPQALNHSFMRPYLTELVNFFYVPAALEIFLSEIIFVLFIFFRKKNIHSPPLIYFCIFFSLTTFLVIGYTIPIIGAIARYRSIYYPLIMTPIACYTDWARLRGIFIR